MLSSIRFSCSLAAAEGPWEETTDEAEKKSLRILSFFPLVKDHPGHLGGFQDVQDCFNIWALSSSLQLEI